MSTVLLKSSKYLKTVSIEGSLFVMNDGYPIVSFDKKGSVIGDIFEVEDTTIKQLDEYEEIDDIYSPYEKVKFDLNGEEIWTYALKNSHKDKLSSFRKISSGDWFDYLKKQRKRIG